MCPEQRAAINQQNSTHSTGPVTESGKATVSGNAVKHALSGKSHAILRGEEEAFALQLDGYVKSYAPQTTPEENLVRTLAENFWRLKRAHQMEPAAFNRAFAEALEESPGAIRAIVHADAFSDPLKEVQRFATYAARIQRALEKTTAELKSLQSERKAAYAKAEEEAILLTHLANTHKKISEAANYFNEGAGSAAPNDPPNPAASSPVATDAAATSGVAPSPVAPNHGGFVYSFEDIKRKIIRQGRLDEARARFAPESSGLAGLLKGALL